jgi:hypothetical protein
MDRIKSVLSMVAHNANGAMQGEIAKHDVSTPIQVSACVRLRLVPHLSVSTGVKCHCAGSIQLQKRKKQINQLASCYDTYPAQCRNQGVEVPFMA